MVCLALALTLGVGGKLIVPYLLAYDLPTLNFEDKKARAPSKM